MHGTSQRFDPAGDDVRHRDVDHHHAAAAFADLPQTTTPDTNTNPWTPVTADILGGDTVLWDYVAHHGREFITNEPPSAIVEEELDRTLAGLADDGGRMGMTGARIVLWAGLDTTQGTPLLVREATADELAIGRLRLAQIRVDHAVRQVDVGRTALRQGDPHHCEPAGTQHHRPGGQRRLVEAAGAAFPGRPRPDRGRHGRHATHVRTSSPTMKS
jgi:hypothetical protein